MPYRMICATCHEDFAARDPDDHCFGCPGRFDFRYDYAAAHCPERPVSGMWSYADLLPLRSPENAVSLGEGATPLLGASRSSGCQLFWKIEARNPTGSQKDRALSVAVSKARELGAPRVIIASTGGAGLACAAYCARGDLPCVVLVPLGTPIERLRPMQALGATVVEVQGTFVQIERLLEQLTADPGWYDATTKRSANPFQAEGPKTIAYELVGSLGRAPDWVVVPVGGGGTLAAIWNGFLDLNRMGRLQTLPRMVAVQAKRLNTLEVALERGLKTQAELETIAVDEQVETILRNLKHGVPPDGESALNAVLESGGRAVSVDDKTALDWQQRLGAEEGLFCEPSSAVVGAAVADLVAAEVIGEGDVVVAVVTGSGFREMGFLPYLPLARLAADASPAELERLWQHDRG